MDKRHTWDIVSVWDKKWQHNKCKSMWPCFTVQRFCLIYRRLLMDERHIWYIGSMWDNDWLDNNCRSTWPIFHGPWLKSIRITCLCNIFLSFVALVMTFVNDNPWYFSCFCSKHELWVLTLTIYFLNRNKKIMYIPAKSICHQVSAQSVFGFERRCRLKNFEMAAVSAILDMRTQQF